MTARPRISTQAAAESLGFSAEVWPRGAFWDAERSYGSLGLGRLGSPMAGTSFKTANIGMLLEAEVPAACASHPFRRMVTDPSEKDAVSAQKMGQLYLF